MLLTALNVDDDLWLVSHLPRPHSYLAGLASSFFLFYSRHCGCFKYSWSTVINNEPNKQFVAILFQVPSRFYFGPRSKSNHSQYVQISMYGKFLLFGKQKQEYWNDGIIGLKDTMCHSLGYSGYFSIYRHTHAQAH